MVLLDLKYDRYLCRKNLIFNSFLGVLNTVSLVIAVFNIIPPLLWGFNLGSGIVNYYLVVKYVKELKILDKKILARKLVR
jgi:hypothetical protein